MSDKQLKYRYSSRAPVVNRAVDTGSNVPENPLQRATPAPASSGGAKFCSQCGTPAGAGRFCSNCGNQVA
jgi:membrane protease subunit (stomatin/prohibitin family)